MLPSQPGEPFPRAEDFWNLGRNSCIDYVLWTSSVFKLLLLFVGGRRGSGSSLAAPFAYVFLLACRARIIGQREARMDTT